MIAFSQDDDDIKRSALGIHFFFNDFKTPARIKATSLTSVLNNKQWAKIKEMSAGLTVNYMKGLTRHLDFSSSLSGSFLDYPIEGKSSFGNDNFLLEGDAMVYAKMLTDKYWVSPYLSAGVGASMYKGSYFAAFIPVGVGLQINFYDDAFLLVNTQYRSGITANATDHFYYSLGLVGNIGKPKEKKVIPPPVPIITDRDADGIVDSLDVCPDSVGVASLNGCPDRDNDGIANYVDKCPDVPGIARYQGCPIPDTDLDGINDEEDSCATVAGVARYKGCPIPDTDGDGVNDEEDKCPNEKGLPENGGCPKLEEYQFKADNVQFVSGKAVLTAKAKTELDKGVVILAEHPKVNISIEGHTDNTGSDATNQKLSAKRAEAVKAYLVQKGIAPERLTTVGFGAASPRADNKTKEGKASNRRVEFKMIL